MGKAKQSSKKKPESQESPSFEESLAELQQIVEELEDGSLGLQESILRFEKGITLLRNCYRILNEAEQKVQVLTGLDSEGNPVTEDFDAGATYEHNKPTAGRRRGKPKRASKDDTAESEQAEQSDRGESLF